MSYRSAERKAPSRRHANVIGPAVARLRYQRGWTQDILATRLQLLGCCVTRDVVANIEARRSVAKDTQIEALALVFEVDVGELFPARDPGAARIRGLAIEPPARQRRRDDVLPAEG